MSVKMLEGILDSTDNKAFLVIQGGEPILHPQIEDILGLLKNRKCQYQLFSNGIWSENLLRLVKKYDVQNVALSCDGTNKVYEEIRGIKNYANILWLLEQLNRNGNKIEISYIISQWNNRDELLKIAQLAKEYRANFHVDVYDEIKYFGTNTPRMKENYKADDVVSYPVSKVLRLYNEWLIKGDISLPCHSILFSCFITTNGGVYSCGRKLEPLGNLNNKSLSDIWNSSETKKIQNELHDTCNECFATCYRNIDVVLGKWL
jgi:MoaA/NifB/PqqE/SkfB family radical SAM enzyme